MLVLDMIYVDWIVKEKKILQVLWDVFLMLWTLWGLGRDKTFQISQRITHKSSKSLPNVTTVSLLYVDKLEWNLKRFHGLGPYLKLLQNLIFAIFDRSSLISRSVELDRNWLPFSAVSWTWSLKPILLSIA